MLKLDDEYYVKTDALSFILMKKYRPTKDPIKGAKRETTESIVGFYATMAHLLNRYRTEKMREWIDSGKMDLKELCERIVEFDEKLMKQMKRFDNIELEPTPKRRKKTEDKI